MWARLIKPVGRTAAGFATSWFLTPEGVRRTCRSAAEAREGARQEWAQLMVEGSPKLQFPIVSQNIDAWGRPRGSLNLAVACLALPGDPIRLLAAAYMGPSGSGYSILYWSLSTDIAVLTSSSLSIRDNHISHRNGFWYLESATLHSRASGLVVCICGENPCTWDINRWLRWINSRTYGGIVYASGWTSWGDLLRPLSVSERKGIMQGSLSSRPGPSYWKTLS